MDGELPVYSDLVCAECGADWESAAGGRWVAFPIAGDIRRRWAYICPACARAGRVVCLDCIDVVQSSDCTVSPFLAGGPVPDPPVTLLTRGMAAPAEYHICRDCLGVDYDICPVCQGVVLVQDMREDHTGAAVCGDCWPAQSYECAGCGAACRIGTHQYGVDGYPYCPECWGGMFFVCAECGQTRAIADRVNGLCPYCANEATARLDDVLGYHQVDVGRTFGFGPPGALPVSGRSYRLGLEVEYDQDEEGRSLSDGLVPRIRNRYTDCVVTADSSVTWGEIVTRPESYERLIEAFGQIFDLRLRSRYGLIVSNTTGLHVNISRSVFCCCEEIAFFILIINNFSDFSRSVAGRRELYHADYTPKSLTEARRDAVGTGKYQPVRVGKDRLEVRIYRSTSRLRTLRLRLQHTLAAAEFAISCASADVLPDIVSFFDFISFHRCCWPELDLHCRQHTGEV